MLKGTNLTKIIHSIYYNGWTVFFQIVSLELMLKGTNFTKIIHFIFKGIL